MPQIIYGKASSADHGELVDFINYVFSHAHSPTDFPTMLPKFYKPENIVAEHHYVAREDGKIKALVAAYPMTYHVSGETLKVFGIGAVSVHPYSRSKGYMKRLMDDALSDMQAQGMDLGCLNGLKQRYEYFGFTPCGTEITLTCTATNVRHTFGSNFSSDIEFKEITVGNTEDLAVIADMHTRKKAYIERPAQCLFDIMKSWENRIYTIWLQNVLTGYMSVQQNHREIYECYSGGTTPLTEIIAAYIKRFNLDNVRIKFSSHETDKIQELNSFAENIEISAAYNFNVMNFPAVTQAFLRLKNNITRLPDGKLALGIQDYGNILISVSDGQANVSFTDEEPEYSFGRLEAMRIFFSPSSAFSLGVMENNIFAKSLFPIPLYLETNDKV